MSTEIKAGQTWYGNEAPNTAEIKHVSDGYVFYVVYDKDGIVQFANGTEEKFFINNYYFKPSPKTRTITRDDILKMLAVNPVVFFRLDSDGQWYILGNPEGMNVFKGYQFSHNPFAPNPVIVGPEIEVAE